MLSLGSTPMKFFLPIRNEPAMPNPAAQGTLRDKATQRP